MSSSTEARQSGSGGHASSLSREHRARHLRAYRAEVIVVLGIIAFAVLALAAWSVPYFGFDLTVARTIQSIQLPYLHTFLTAVNWIGYPPQSNFIFGSVILGLFVIGKRWEAAGLFVAAAGSASLWFVVAPLVNRARPTPDLIYVESQIGHGSFPSGHVLNLTAIFGFLLYLAFTQLKPSWWRTVLMVLLTVPILTIGFARIYAGQHWPSDVLGGYLLGSVWLGVSIVLYRRLSQYFTHGEPFGSHPADATAHPADSAADRRVPT